MCRLRGEWTADELTAVEREISHRLSHLMFALCVLGFGREGSDHFVFNELDLLSHLGDIGSRASLEERGFLGCWHCIDYLTFIWISQQRRVCRLIKCIHREILESQGLQLR